MAKNFVGFGLIGKLVLLVVAIAGVAGCGSADSGSPAVPVQQPAGPKLSLAEARKNFKTKLISFGEEADAPETPPPGTFDLIQYAAPLGNNAAYVSVDPKDGKQHPAIVWIQGGTVQMIGDSWSPQDRANAQSVPAFRNAGIVTMFPSLRGGHKNPGRMEGFLGEVDDVIAAAEHLAKLPYVDPQRIYLGGHSSGGTLVLLVAESTDRFRAVLSLGAVHNPGVYGDFVYCDPRERNEMALRSPIHWLHCVKSPLFVMEGNEPNWQDILEMRKINTNPQIQFFHAPQHDHFSIIAPITELFAQQIVADKVGFTQQMVDAAR